MADPQSTLKFVQILRLYFRHLLALQRGERYTPELEGAAEEEGTI